MLSRASISLIEDCSRRLQVDVQSWLCILPEVSRDQVSEFPSGSPQAAFPHPCPTDHSESRSKVSLVLFPSVRSPFSLRLSVRHEFLYSPPMFDPSALCWNSPETWTFSTSLSGTLSGPLSRSCPNDRLEMLSKRLFPHPIRSALLIVPKRLIAELPSDLPFVPWTALMCRLRMLVPMVPRPPAPNDH